ncbi:BAR-domain-containing protein [Gigaspora margarita]|uniref:BAR-domain-containing protein n=1 Tax=Gigaspora margarita TaxID=4874 RepID=A0A8H4ENJ6_GIGMA|nr:BAR-domain-containing protein [Gigaspora margarita]
MSWKGTTKAFGRLPQRIATKTGLRTETKDIRDGVSNMLNHQANFADLLVELYNPITSEEASDGVVTRRTKTPAQAMKATEEYAKLMSEVRDTILSELDSVDRRIIMPATEFLDVIKIIKKTVTKREHKKVDYDRYQNSVKKLKDKKDKSLSEEKQLHKYEDQLERATQEYDHYNEMLKKELPLFFEYRVEFIEPIFECFYHMQLRIYGLLFEQFEQLAELGYFDFESDIIDGFDKKIVDAKEQLEDITLFKRSKQNKKQDESSRKQSSIRESARTGSSGQVPTYSKDHIEEDDEPPAYTPTPVRAQPPPPPPVSRKPKPVRYVVALYDYDATADGDLSFRKDDKIELIKRTPDANDWWTGKLNGVTGVFPGNYVAEL